jgi:hypothetical protein
MMWLEFAVVAVAIYLGARMGGIGLGVTGMLGMLIFTLGFGLKPADPPLEVMLIILSVVTTAAAMQAAGGMDYLVSVAAKLLRSKPNQITLLGPLVVYIFTMFAGTAHIIYSLLPVISEVATKKKNSSRTFFKHGSNSSSFCHCSQSRFCRNGNYAHYCKRWCLGFRGYSKGFNSSYPYWGYCRNSLCDETRKRAK